MSYVQIKYIQNAHIKFKHIHMSNYSLKPVFSTRYREFILSYREEVSSNRFNIIVLSSLWLTTHARWSWHHLAVAHAAETLIFQVPEARSAVIDATVLGVTVQVLPVKSSATYRTSLNTDSNKLEQSFNPAEIITQNQYCVQPVECFIFFREVVHLFNDRFVKHLAFFKQFVVQVSNAFSLPSGVKTRRNQTAKPKDKCLEKDYQEQNS